MALLVLTPNAALDPVGVAAGRRGGFHGVRNRADPQVATSRASAHLYRPQLAAGGLLLVPVALVFDPPIPMPTGTNVLGPWLGLIGAGLTYFGSGDLATRTYSCFLTGLSQPGDRRVARMVVLDQTLSALQIIGVLLVIGSIWLGQRSNRTPRARIACRKSP
ncbi:hypothetical protein ECZU24_59990 [Escherichia coli]|nr:hypothetical protein ECZU24_59990 [Escherichia coli]